MKNKKLISVTILAAILIFNLITAVSAAPVNKTITAVYNDIKIIIDGKIIEPKDSAGKPVEPFIYDGTTYLPVKAVAQAVGYDVSWDSKTYTVNLTKNFGELTAELDNYAPTQNATINLTVKGAGFEGMPYEARLIYKTTQTIYTGIVGEPCGLKTSSATKGYTVYIIVIVKDDKNNKEYNAITSFTPPEE
jgi:hypothetical protein